MVTNLYLDPTTHDLVVDETYNLRLTADVSELLVQKLVNVLKTFYGEWFLDYTIGIPYFDRVLIKKADLNDVNSIFLAAITAVPEVKKVIYFTTDFDLTLRTYKISFKVQSQDDSFVETTGVTL